MFVCPGGWYSQWQMFEIDCLCIFLMFLPWSSLLFEARNDEINYSEEQQ
jgi:membrane protein CcdC involved in cytochrome C biogenesis